MASVYVQEEVGDSIACPRFFFLPFFGYTARNSRLDWACCSFAVTDSDPSEGGFFSVSVSPSSVIVPRLAARNGPFSPSLFFPSFEIAHVISKHEILIMRLTKVFLKQL